MMPSSTASGHQDDDAFETYFRDPKSSRGPVRMEGGLGWRPATDVYETETHLVVQMDLAGMGKEAIEVLVDDERLVVRGTRANIAAPGRKHFHEMEIRVGPFERQVRVPGHVDPHTAEARYESGFLFVTMEKGQDVERAHRGQRRTIAIGA